MGRPKMPQKPPVHEYMDSAPMLTREFTEQEILEFKEAFTMFDLDGGGTLTSYEFANSFVLPVHSWVL
jgi:Ca2+-binding EF-hand superfamily protein